jgi:pimeloyl-ACP methyl ester carboxylesterase
MARATIAGHELYYLRRGSGEPLLLIQGMAGNTAHWGEPFLAELEGDFELVAYDHREVGQSARVGRPFTIADLADDAVGLLAALGIERAHVLGISMGGMVAQEVALRHPDVVRSLVLGCTYPGGARARLTDPAVMQRLAEPMFAGDTERALRAGWEANVSRPVAADPAAWEAFLVVARQHPASLQALMGQMQAIQGHDTSARLRQIRAPTLVVHGTEDEMLSADNGRLIAELIPGARLELLEGVGHMWWWEQPERSAALVREFCTSAANSQAA